MAKLNWSKTNQEKLVRKRGHEVVETIGDHSKKKKRKNGATADTSSSSPVFRRIKTVKANKAQKSSPLERKLKHVKAAEKRIKALEAEINAYTKKILKCKTLIGSQKAEIKKQMKLIEEIRTKKCV